MINKMLPGMRMLLLMRVLKFLPLVLCCAALCGCKKYLDKVSDSTLIVPTTVADLQQLLDNDMMTKNSTPGLGQLGTDDYYVMDAVWLSADALARDAYTWQMNLYAGQPLPAWNIPYMVVYYANVVLDNLDAVASTDPASYQATRGRALFYRAFMFYELEEVFGQPYIPASSSTDIGIVLRLHSDPGENAGNATVASCYKQITADLQLALPLLPGLPDPDNPNRPSRSAVFALLARVSLTMQDYTDAGRYADSSLALYSALIDYNTLNAAASRPFAMPANPEVLFQCSTQADPLQYGSTTAVDTGLYASYDSNDLRRAVFFGTNAVQGTKYFKGQYSGLVYLFSGLATDEMFLVRAECEARAGDADAAMADLNSLLVTRWKTGRFQPLAAATADQALHTILEERRKETLYRDLRWPDLRRLNQDPRFADTLRRVLNGQGYTLMPGAPGYTYAHGQ